MLIGNINVFYWEKKQSILILICVLEIWKVGKSFVVKIFVTIQFLSCRLNIYGVRKSFIFVNIFICKFEFLLKFCCQNSLDNLYFDYKIVVMNQFIFGKMLLKLSYYE